MWGRSGNLRERPECFYSMGKLRFPCCRSRQSVPGPDACWVSSFIALCQDEPRAALMIAKKQNSYIPKALPSSSPRG